MPVDPCFIGIVYKGPKRFRGSRQKVLALPVGAVSSSEIVMEVTFHQPRFLAAIPAKFVAALVLQDQFDYANDEQKQKHLDWVERHTIQRAPHEAPVLEVPDDEEIIEVEPPTDDEVDAEIAQALAAHDAGVVEVDEPPPAPQRPSAYTKPKTTKPKPKSKSKAKPKAAAPKPAPAPAPEPELVEV